MCDPVTIGATVAVVGAVTGGVLGRQAGEYNADVAERQADVEQLRTEQGIENTRRRGALLRARQRSLFAGAGLRTEGTPMEVLADTAREEELAVENLRFGQAMTRANLESQADMSRVGGTQALVSGLGQAAGLAISGGATAQQFGFGRSAAPVDTAAANPFMVDPTGRMVGGV